MSPMELIYAKLKEARERCRNGIGDPVDRIIHSLRDYQLNAVFSVAEASEQGKLYHLIVGAVGVGKSRIATTLVRCMNGVLITPSINIQRGMLEGLGIDTSKMSDSKVANKAWEFRISTPTRLANRLSKGDDPICDDPPKLLVVDEAHGHVESNTIAGALRAMLPGALLVGLTATPYRGTARGTKEFRELWGEPYVALSMPQAIERGIILAPRFEYFPLVDTTGMTITNGEFDDAELTEAYLEVAPQAAKIAVMASRDRGLPTVVSVSSTAVAHRVVQEIEALGVPAAAILQDTTGLERGELFDKVSRNEVVLVQIRCLSVGVDIPPLTALVDCQATQSAVLFLQTAGRILRKDPGNPGKQPVIFSTNSNVINHGRCFVGTPAYRDVVDICEKEPKRDDRQFLRQLVVGTEANLSRVAILKARNLSGQDVTFLNLCAPIAENSPIFHEHLIVRVPGRRQKILHAERLTGANIDWSAPEAQWKQTPLPRELTGLKTQKKRNPEMSEKQVRFWMSCARSVGLDPDIEIETQDTRLIGLLATCRSLRWNMA